MKILVRYDLYSKEAVDGQGFPCSATEDGVQASDQPGWRFKKLDRDDKSLEPIQREFFTTEIVGGLPEALVREAIQNSLDAIVPDAGEPVKVRIALSAEDRQIAQDLLHGLEPHLQAKRNGLRRPPNLGKPMGFVVIEDFGTVGLQGSFQEYDVDEDLSGDHNFFYFWRNVGNSGKSEKDRGRWGLGKTVFPASSRMNTFFGLTVPFDTRQHLLMGQCVLRTHKDAAGDRFSPYGDFGVFDGPDSFALPVRDSKAIVSFSQAFGLKRRGETGLSIVILNPLEEFTHDTFLRAVLDQYFYPILCGDLLVEVEQGAKSVEIRRDNLRSVIDDCGSLGDQRSSLTGFVDLADWAIRGSVEHVEIALPNYKAAPRWSTVSFSDDELGRLQSQFLSGERIAFKVLLRVHEKSGLKRDTWFFVYLEQDSSLQKGEGRFVREGITIKSVSGNLERGVRGLVLIEDAPIAALLGDSENPAHTEWQRDSRKIKDKYDYGPSTIDFVKASARELVKFLLRPSSGVDKDLFRDIFFFERPADSPGEHLTKPDLADGGNATRPPKPDLPRRSEPIHLAQIEGGIRVTANKDVESLPRSIRLELAYEVRRGNPFKRYRLPDFNLATMEMKDRTRGIAIQELGSNYMVFEPESKDFEVKIIGFDASRDLVVRVEYLGD